MERKLSLSTVKCCLGMRIPPNDFMKYNTSALTPEDVQLKLFPLLETIATSNCYYVKLFLSHYIDILEKSDEPIVDNIYELYCSPRILSATPLPPTATDTLQYVIDEQGNSVSITETPKIISGAGTTGLRTWEAALFLLAFLNWGSLESPKLQGKTVVELGAGTGLVSLGLLKNYDKHKFAKIMVTDGDSALVENLAATLCLNHIDRSLVETQQLWWGTTDPHDKDNFVQHPPFGHVVVAADVTYDGLVVPLLSSTLKDFFNNGAEVAYVAATVRNTDTLAVWERELLEKFVWSVCCRCGVPHDDSEVAWYRLGTPEIRIYEVRDKWKRERKKRINCSYRGKHKMNKDKKLWEWWEIW